MGRERLQVSKEIFKKHLSCKKILVSQLISKLTRGLFKFMYKMFKSQLFNKQDFL